jgi:hypothetical protein
MSRAPRLRDPGWLSAAGLAKAEATATYQSGTFICNSAHPWRPGIEGERRVYHAVHREVGEQVDGWPGGDIVRYECLSCGHTWTAELPQ